MNCENRKSVLLVNPPYGLAQPEPNGSSLVPPLALGYLAGALRLDNVDVQLADMSLSTDSLSQKLGEKEYDVVGVTGMSPQLPSMIKIAGDVKRACPDSLVVVGGGHVTATVPSISSLSSNVDAVVVGDGEIPLRMVVSRVPCSAQDLADVPNVWRLVGSAAVPPISILPCSKKLHPISPAFDLFSFPEYQLSQSWGNVTPYIASLITSRGCPFKCSYCSNSSVGSNIRYVPLATVEREIHTLAVQHGVRTIIFWDDTFTFSRKRTLAICEMLKKYDVDWLCNTRADCVDPNLLECMADSNCRSILFGVETFAEEILTSLDRMVPIGSVRAAITAAKSFGIRTIASMMIGCPGQTLELLRSDFELLGGIGPDAVRISVFNILPGTRIYELAVSRKWLPQNVPWGDTSLFPGHPLGLPTVNEFLTRTQLQQNKQILEQQLAKQPVSGRF